MSEKLASVIDKFCYNHRFVIDTHHSTPQKYSFPKSFANNLRSKSTQKYTLGEISFKKIQKLPAHAWNGAGSFTIRGLLCLFFRFSHEGARMASLNHDHFPVLYIHSLLGRSLYSSTAEVVKSIRTLFRYRC